MDVLSAQLLVPSCEFCAFSVISCDGVVHALKLCTLSFAVTSGLNSERRIRTKLGSAFELAASVSSWRQAAPLGECLV